VEGKMQNATIIGNFVTLAGLLAGFSLTVVAMLYSETNNEVNCKKIIGLISEAFLLLSTVSLITACISGSILLSLPNYKTDPLMETPVEVTLCALGIGLVLFYLGTVLLSYRKSILIGLFVTLASLVSFWWIYHVYFWLPSQLIPVVTKLFG
jgi:hypothetical protein